MLHVLESIGIVLLIALCIFAACVVLADWLLGASFRHTLKWHRKRKP